MRRALLVAASAAALLLGVAGATPASAQGCARWERSHWVPAHWSGGYWVPAHHVRGHCVAYYRYHRPYYAYPAYDPYPVAAPPPWYWHRPHWGWGGYY